MSSPEVIYLAPECHEQGERLWCEDDMWVNCHEHDGEHCEVAHQSVRYVRGDVHDALAQRCRELEGERADLWKIVDSYDKHSSGIHALAEIERLRTELSARPTTDAYDAACAALWRHRDDAADLRAEVEALREAQSQAAADILAERRRQVDAEGWSPEHDDEHGDGQMAVAAGYYALACGYPHERDIGRGHVPAYWPWDRSWWKPKDCRSNLIRAGALILAEIERLDRAAMAAKEV